MPTHTEKRIMPYTAKQMYDLVADVESYPEFLPWCAASRIRNVIKDDHKTIVEADLIIAFKVFREVSVRAAGVSQGHRLRCFELQVRAGFVLLALFFF